MSDDDTLSALALVELIAGLNGGAGCEAETLESYRVLLDTGSRYQHAGAALYLAQALVNICRATRFPLAAFIEAERLEAIGVPPEPGGMA